MADFENKHKDELVKEILELQNKYNSLEESHQTELDRQKQIEKELRLSEEKFRSVFENSLTGISLTSLDGKMNANKAFCQILGYSENELNKLSWQSITHPDDVERDEQEIADLLAGKSTKLQLEKRFINKQGEIVWVELQTSVYTDFNKTPLYFITSVNDITHRKKAEEVEKRFEFLFQNTPALIGVSSSPDRRFTDVNQTFLNVLGFAREEVIGKTAGDLNLFINAEQLAEYANRFQRDGRIVDLDLMVRCKDGSILNGSVSSEAIIINGQQFFLTVFTDITERKKAEEALKESETKYKGLFNSVQDALLITNIDRNIIECNPAFTALFGYTLEELKGKQTSFLYEYEEQTKTLGKDVNNYLYKDFTRYRKKNGEVFPGETGIHYLKNNEDETVSYLGWIRDITERIKTESEIRSLNEELEQKVKTRTRELENKYLELERLNKLFVDRELRMVELKKIIKNMEEKIENK